jgi:hypothetical protein
VDSEDLQASAERDQLWASLRQLRRDLDELAAGSFDGSEREKQVIQLMARIILAELDFRARGGKEP